MHHRNFLSRRIHTCRQIAYGVSFYNGKHAAGAITSGFDSIHLEMVEFVAAFNAGRECVNRLFRRVFFCLSFLLLNALLPFMSEQGLLPVQQETGVQPAVDTDSGCLAFENGIRHLPGEYQGGFKFLVVSITSGSNLPLGFDFFLFFLYRVWVAAASYLLLRSFRGIC